MLEKTNSRIFTFLMGVSAIAVAAAAAIFSVTGLSMLYSGEMVYVAIAMGALEFSKIITASYLYRYWKDTGFGLKTYLTIALLVLMLVTSGGIYGYLTNSYQGATVGLDKIDSQTQVLEQRKQNIIDERERLVSDITTLRSERQSTIENRNNEIMANNMATDSNSVKFRAWRNSQVHKRYNEELLNIDNNVSKYTNDLDSTNVRLSRINDDISDKKLEMIDTGVEVGPLVYMARIFNTTMDNVMKWFTLVIVFVFDPLAIALIIALNVILMKSKKEKVKYHIGVDKADEKDYSCIITGERNEDESLDLGEPDDLSFMKTAKPIEKSFNDIEEKIDEQKEEDFLKKFDVEVEEMADEEIGFEDFLKSRPDRRAIWLEDKDKPKKTDQQVELELNGNFADALNGTTKKVGKDESTKERINDQESIKFADIQKDEPEEEIFDDEIDKTTNPTGMNKVGFYETEVNNIEELINNDSPVSQSQDELSEFEIEKKFEEAARKERKKQIGEVKRVTYEPGGEVNIDYSIQE